MASGTQVHATAVVDPAARLGQDVIVGPLCVVGPDVELGDGVELKSHVAVAGHTSIGAGTVVFPFASLGHAPQDLKYHGEPSRLEIGARNRIREHVTMNPGTEGGGMLTRVGDDGLYMVGVHIAHDCMVGNRVIMANNVTLAGHVVVEDNVVIGGLSAFHQFVRIGAGAMIGGMSAVESDVVPFALVKGDRAFLDGLNYVGLQRRGVEKAQIHELREIYRQVFEGEGTLKERLAAAAGKVQSGTPAGQIIEFMLARESRAFCQPRR
ncbi:acyl-ACP--UDP-N-acetylglucosamine O-acyltransferase [Radicibacter daui]|uniref:acyl-ACP--UDP-N-acetylglucosamine O-acyltransferase n=1 Tax=Radicibacter daui TaxID=3064829 RepID=UPI004046DE2A